jgi:4-carboxymuconolactone decarboxylase
MTNGSRPLSVEELNTEQRRLLAKLRSGARSGFLASFEGAPGEWALPGPFGPMLLAPAVGDPLQALGEAIRYRGCLPDEVRELAIVATASASGSTYELEHHLPLARAAGLPEEVLNAAMQGNELPDPLLAAVSRVSRSLAETGRADPASLDLIGTRLGAPALFELVVLSGYYRLLANVLSVYGIGS